MARPRLLPTDDELLAMRDAGMSAREIADAINTRNREVMGSDYRPITRSAVATAFSRMQVTRRVRYADQIPWRVKPIHQHEYPLFMLRLRARRLRGIQLAPDNEERLESWLAWLAEERAVVTYLPSPVVVDGEIQHGFVYVPRDPSRDADDDVIRRPGPDA